MADISVAPEEPTVESRNKEALSRVVMAGMRMYGLQQRRKTKSRRGSVALSHDCNDHISEEQAAQDAVKDEEYKLIYHQTFKGAILALVCRSYFILVVPIFLMVYNREITFPRLRSKTSQIDCATQ